MTTTATAPGTQSDSSVAPATSRTVPDLILRMNNRALQCDVTVVDSLAGFNLATAASASQRHAALHGHDGEEEPGERARRGAGVSSCVCVIGRLCRDTVATALLPLLNFGSVSTWPNRDGSQIAVYDVQITINNILGSMHQTCCLHGLDTTIRLTD